jgi:hypothetical protein
LKGFLESWIGCWLLWFGTTLEPREKSMDNAMSPTDDRSGTLARTSFVFFRSVLHSPRVVVVRDIYKNGI